MNSCFIEVSLLICSHEDVGNATPSFQKNVCTAALSSVFSNSFDGSEKIERSGNICCMEKLSTNKKSRATPLGMILTFLSDPVTACYIHLPFSLLVLLLCHLSTGVSCLEHPRKPQVSVIVLILFLRPPTLTLSSPGNLSCMRSVPTTFLTPPLLGLRGHQTLTTPMDAVLTSVLG